MEIRQRMAYDGLGSGIFAPWISKLLLANCAYWAFWKALRSSYSCWSLFRSNGLQHGPQGSRSLAPFTACCFCSLSFRPFMYPSNTNGRFGDWPGRCFWPAWFPLEPSTWIANFWAPWIKSKLTGGRKYQYEHHHNWHRPHWIHLRGCHSPHSVAGRNGRSDG